MNKLAAFTITELMVVSLLGTICAAAAFTGLQVIQKQYFFYEKETSRVLEVGELQRQLQVDILAAKAIYREEEGIGLSLPNYELHYVFTDQELHRVVALDGIRKRVFSLKVTAIGSRFRSTPIDQGQLDFLALSIACDGALFSLTFEKEYSASEKMTLRN